MKSLSTNIRDNRIMEEQKKELNLVEILKDCPEGMALDCTMYEEATLIHILGGNAYPIKIETPDGQISLNKYGKYSNNKLAKCVIFPKGKTTWEGFVPPCQFKDGDFIYSESADKYIWISIFKEYLCDGQKTHADLSVKSNIIFTNSDVPFCKMVDNEVEYQRLATDEEKQQLLEALHSNGYKWNAEAKKIEKIEEDKPKWNPDTLQPFDKVLVRDDDLGYWGGDFYLYTDKETGSDYPYSCVASNYRVVIPYNEETKHMLGTNKEEPEFYRL